MISLPTPTQPIIEDTNEDAHVDRNDLTITLTYSEHEMLCEVLLQAVEMISFACPYGYFDLPMDSELIQRFSTIENLRERFNESWSDRFKNNEIH
jgi:hypothetical protein